MIIKTFSAKKVFGYLDFSITFNPDINFLVGGNGSGKTTALRLINALLIPNFSELIFTPFSNAQLSLEDRGETLSIEAISSEETITLSISNLDDKLVLPNYSEEDNVFYGKRIIKKSDLIEEINRDNASHPIVKNIANITSPIFLGLDRKRDSATEDKSDYYFEREMRIREYATTSRTTRTRRLIRGSLGPSLMETELLVQDAYRNFRRIEDRQSSKLRDSILLSVFKYVDFHALEGQNIEESWSEKLKLLERKKEIKDSLSKIGIRDTKLSNEIDTFFERLTTLFESMGEGPEGSINVEFLTNKSQIDRIEKIVDVIDSNKSMVDKYFKPISDFLSTVNEFYKDSGKTLHINAVGQLEVERPDKKKTTIEGLSSGERQLLVIFSHVYFNNSDRKGKSSVFIIDEPELSLHLGWQEKFSEIILSINPTSQFIMATHSPEIVGSNKKKAIKCR